MQAVWLGELVLVGEGVAVAGGDGGIAPFNTAYADGIDTISKVQVERKVKSKS